MQVVAYYRASLTESSAPSPEAQRKAVCALCNHRGWTVIADFTEIESGMRNARPQLLAALRRAKASNAVLCIAQLDRLARDTKFLRTLVNEGTEVVFADLPQIDGPWGPLVLKQMAAVAELEAGLTRKRAKAALAASKARAMKPNNRNRGNPLLRARSSNRAPMEVRSEAAQKFARDRAQDIAEVREVGAKSLQEIADGLNARGVTTPNGGQWHRATVRRVLMRIDA